MRKLLNERNLTGFAVATSLFFLATAAMLVTNGFTEGWLDELGGGAMAVVTTISPLIALVGLYITRHSSEVEVRLSTTASGLDVTVRDDGRGFDPEVPSGVTKRGMGLTNMRERADILNARLSIQSRPGDGCRVHLSIPLREA